jgi:hypothetical protein
LRSELGLALGQQDPKQALELIERALGTRKANHDVDGFIAVGRC